MSTSNRIQQKKAAKRLKKRTAEMQKRSTAKPALERPTAEFILGTDTKPHALKMSTTLWTYAEPLLKYADTPERAPAMLRAAAFYWNLSFLPEDEWRAEINHRAAALSPEDRELHLNDAQAMIDRRWALYPTEKRRITNLNIYSLGEKLRINVTAELP